MIKLLEKGKYLLHESKRQTKILALDNGQTFAWINAENIGEILVTADNQQSVDSILSQGTFCLYEVKDEPKLVDQIHLELEVGQNKWQGYLLPTGLPTKTDIRNRIIPTPELIGESNL